MSRSAEFETGYRGSHEAPGPDFGAPMHDLTGFYPDDVYSPKGAHIYGDLPGSRTDAAAVEQLRAVRGNPTVPVTVYRAVPEDATPEIHPGDWVTPSRAYADQHGASNLDGRYRIARKTVPAKHLYTNADSLHEWGYHPD